MNIIEFLNKLIPAQVFGWAVIHSLWMGMVIWLLYTLGKSVFNRSTSLKYYWALTMQLLLFFSFLGSVMFQILNSTGSGTRIDLGNTNEMSNLQMTNTINNSFDFTNFSESGIGGIIDASTPVISVIWVLGALFMIMRFSANLFYVQNLRKTGIENIDDYWTDKFKSLIDNLNLNKKVNLLESQMINSPMTIGHFKPLILIPTGMISQLPYEQVEAILLHELAHIKRSDYLVNLIQNTIESLLFFHPVTWILSSNIRIERENLCDDYSINTQKDPMHLAKALFEIQKNVSHVPGLALGSNGSKYLLKKRIERLFNNNGTRSGFDKGIIPAALLTVFVLSMSIFQFKNITAADSGGIMTEASIIPEILEIPEDWKDDSLKELKNVESSDIPSKEERVKSNHEVNKSSFNKGKIKSSIQNKSNTISISASEDEITVKKTTGEGQKIEVVFSSPKDIKKLKIDGKKIKEEDFDQFSELLDREVFSSLGSNEKSKSISYSYQYDDEKNVKDNDKDKTIVVHSDQGNQNKIVIKIDKDNGQSEVIEIAGPDFEIIQVQEIMEDVISDLDIEINDEDFSKEVIESITIEKLNQGFEEIVRSLEQSSKELEEKSKALNMELNDVEMANIEKEMKKAIAEIQSEIENIKRKDNELSKKEKSYRIQVVAAENAHKEASGKMEKMIRELENDGLLEKDLKKLQIQFKKGSMIINGKKQSDDIAKKYIDMLDIEVSANINYSKSLD